MDTATAKPALNPNNRPPLVKGLPLLGSVREFTGDVLPWIKKVRQEHGEAFRMKIVGMELTMLCGQDAIDMLEDDTYLGQGKSMHVLGKALGSRLPATFDGPELKRFRKIHSSFLNRRLELERREEIQQCFDLHTDKWKVGDSIDVLDASQTQSVDVLSNMLNGEPFPFSSKDLGTIVHTIIWATYGHIPTWIALGNPAFRSAHKRVRAHLEELVKRVRKDPELAQRTLVGQYLDFPAPMGMDGWENSDLVAVPYGGYLGAYDTLASASSFLLYQLLTHPEKLAKVRDEYETIKRENPGPVDPLAQKYLRACFLETVRLNPPGSVVVRFATQDFEFGGYTIRKGDEVLIHIASHHLREDLFPNVNEWEPERFMGGEKETILLKRHVLPFSSGAHRCTGAVIGELMAVEMVSNWVNKFDLELDLKKGKLGVVARPFTQPVGLNVKVVGRREEKAAAA